MPRILLTLLALAACLASASARSFVAAVPAVPSFWAYQACEDGSIAAFSVAPNGDLIRKPYGAPAEGKKATLLRHPARPVLYALTESVHATAHAKEKAGGGDYLEFRLRVFGVGAEGRLISCQTLLLNLPPLAFSPDGKWMYVPIGGGYLQIYAIGDRGTLSEAGKTVGGGVTANAQWGVEDAYSLVFTPSGQFAFRVHHWRMVSQSGTFVERFRVMRNGQLKAESSEPPFALTDVGWDGNNASLSFSRDGRTALMNRTVDEKYSYWRNQGFVNALAINERGQFRNGTVRVPGQGRGPEWTMGEISGLDRTGRLVLLSVDINIMQYGGPFRIGLIGGPGQLRETARFGKHPEDLADFANKDASFFYSANLRPDDYIDAIAQSNGFSPTFYRAQFRLRSDGTVVQNKPWAKLPAITAAGKPITPFEQEAVLGAVFIERTQ